MKDLLRYGRGMTEEPRLIDIGKTRRKFEVAVWNLLDCCLLMSSDWKECVKMHDLVRDVASWIASNEGQAVLVVDKTIPKMLKEDEIVMDTSIISLWDLKSPELPQQLHCSALKILLNCSFLGRHNIPNAYLEDKKDLKVLALIEFSYSWMEEYWMICRSFVSTLLTLLIPQSISSLTNIRTLCLRGYSLGDISILGSSKRLEILYLRGSSFIELSDGIGALSYLKLLDLFKCDIEINNPYEVVTRCSLLQELYISAPGNYSLENVSFQKLQRYFIWLSEENFITYFEIFEENIGLKFLGIDLEVLHASALSDSSIKELFLRADSLYLKVVLESYKDMIMEMDKQRINWLTLESCSGMTYLVDTTAFVDSSANSISVDVNQAEPVLSHLVLLQLLRMEDLEELFRDSSSKWSLNKLQELRIKRCPQLYSVFPRNSNLCSLKIIILSDCPQLASSLFLPSIAQALVLLEELYIYRCVKLKYIIDEEQEERNVNCHSNQGLGHLRILEVVTCDSLESLLPISFAKGLVRLETLSLRENSTLKSIFGTEKGCWRPLKCLPALTDLDLYKQPNLFKVKRVVATTLSQFCKESLPATLQAFLHLEVLRIGRDERLEGIFEVQPEEALNCELDKEQAPLKLSSNLMMLECRDLDELRFIWHGPANLLRLHRLRRVSLYNCPKLNSIFPMTVVASLPELELLEVDNCNELKEIIYLDSVEAELNNNNPSAYFP